MDEKSVNIIVLNWNQKDLSLKCISSLKKTTYKNKNIIFIDNGSDDGSIESVKSIHPDVEIIRSENNLGYAAGNNFGFCEINRPSKYTIITSSITKIIF